MIAYKGDILYTPTPDRFEVFEDGYVLVENGKVVQVSGIVRFSTDIEGV